MRIITVINAKGGCGKSTIAMSLASGLAIRGQTTLLIDMDPQAQVTQWLGLGDGLSSPGTLVQAMEGKATMDSIVQATKFENLSFVASSQGLEDLGRQITDMEGYQTILTQLLSSLTRSYEFVVIDSPNQISPVMENCIYPSDAFIVPFESTKAVRSYANFFQLLLRIRPGEQHKVLHVLSNLSRQPGLRRRVVQTLELHGIPKAATEIRTCGWLAQVDENGGSIFQYRPHSKGAEDMADLVDELLRLLGREDLAREISAKPAVEPVETGSVDGHANITPENTGAIAPDIGLVAAAADGGLSINHEQHDQAA
jgi:chromosome partitioning protein